MPLEVIVRSTEIDANDHVNNSQYVQYLQWGRWDWLEGAGFSREQLRDLGTYLAVVHLDLNFRLEATHRETLSVSTRVERIGSKSFDVRQEIRRADVVIFEALVTLVTCDVAARKSREMPAELLAFLRDETSSERAA